MKTYKDWVNSTQDSLFSLLESDELEYWIEQTTGENLLKLANDVGSTCKLTNTFTYNLSGTDNNRDVQDKLIAALTHSIYKTLNNKEVIIEREGHGRNTLAKDIELSDTVGWFTCKFPIKYMVQHDDIWNHLKEVKYINSNVPNNGVGYGILKFFSPRYVSKLLSYSPVVSFNFLGDLTSNNYDEKNSFITANHTLLDLSFHHEVKLPYLVDINAWIDTNKLFVRVNIDGDILGKTFNRERFMSTFNEVATALILNTKNQYVAGGITPFQKGIIAYCKSNASNSHYLIQWKLNINGNIDFYKLKRACNVLTQRYEILRSVYSYDEAQDRFSYKVFAEHEPDCKFYDISGSSPELAEAELSLLYENDRLRGFDIESEPLLRFALIKTGMGNNIILITTHHLIMDGSSSYLLRSELFDIYSKIEYIQDRKIYIAPTVQFFNYADWINKKDKVIAQKYWLEILSSYEPTILDFRPVTKSRVRESYTHLNSEYQLSLDSIDFLNRKGVSLSSTFNSLLGLMLSRYHGKSKIIWGNALSLRPAELENADSVIGSCISTIPICGEYDTSTCLLDFIKALQIQVLESRNYSYLGLAEISKTVNKSILFNSLFTYQNYSKQEINSENLPFYVENIELAISSHFSLTIVFEQHESKLTTRLSFNNSLFEAEQVEQIIKQVVNLFNRIASIESESVKNICVFDGEDGIVASELINWDTNRNDKSKSLIEMFNKATNTSPDSVAVVDADNKQYTYRQIDLFSDKVAYELTGIDGTDAVGISISRSYKMVVAVLGVIKAGLRFVSLEKDFPEEKIAWICKELSVKTVIKDKNENIDLSYVALREVLLDDSFPQEKQSCVSTHISLSDICAVNYTSGSTGKPKLVLTDHLSHINRLDWLQQNFRAESDDIFCLKTRLAFAPAMREIFEPLTQGAKLYILPEKANLDFKDFIKCISKNKITRLFLTPAYLNLTFDNGCINTLSSIKILEISGEPVSLELVKRIKKELPGIKIYNRYGATEAASVVYSDMTKIEALPEGLKYCSLGKPIQNTAIFVVDELMRVCPRGIVGEILIASESLAQGYNDLERTKESFVEIDYIASINLRRKLFKTGDLGFIDCNGELCYLGRKTRMFKMRGFRIEPREIEFHLEQLNGIARAVVVKIDNQVTQKMVAFYVWNKDTSNQPCKTSLRAFLKTRLPLYMVPNDFICIETIPMTNSGKVNFVALQDMAANANQYPVTSIPLTQTESLLYTIFCKLLKIDSFNVRRDFFELGIDSIFVLRLAHEIENTIGTVVEISDFYEHSNVSDLASFIDSLSNVSFERTPYFSMNYNKDNEILFLLPPAGGSPYIYKVLEDEIPSHISVIALEAPYLNKPAWQSSYTVEKIAEYYVEWIEKISEGKAFYLGGWSLGGTIAYEVASQLENKGIGLGIIYLIDPGFRSKEYDDAIEEASLIEMFNKMAGDSNIDVLEQEKIIKRIHNDSKLIKSYIPFECSSDIVLIKPKEISCAERNYDKEYNGLDGFAKGKITVCYVDGNHISMMTNYSKQIWKIFDVNLNKERRGETSSLKRLNHKE